MAKKGGGSHKKKCQEYKTQKKRESNKARNISTEEHKFLKHVEKVSSRVKAGTATPKMLTQIKRYKTKGVM